MATMVEPDRYGDGDKDGNGDEADGDDEREPARAPADFLPSAADFLPSVADFCGSAADTIPLAAAAEEGLSRSTESDCSSHARLPRIRKCAGDTLSSTRR